jgi:hypothetical protein
MQSLPVSERYDAKTDEISKLLGNALNLSPKKINYLLNQYGGVLSDVILPTLTPAAESNPISSNFTLNTLSSNRYTDEFYDAKKQAEYSGNSLDATPADKSALKYWTQQSLLLRKINQEIRRIEADDSLSGREKKEMLEAQYALRNALYQKALNNEEGFKSASEAYYDSADSISDDEARLDYAYTMASETVAPEISTDNTSKKVYDKFSSEGYAQHICENYSRAISALKPLEGKKSVSLPQKWEAIIDVGYPELTTLGAMKTLITGDEDSKASQILKLDLCYNNGVPLDAYTQLKLHISEYDSNGNGSYSSKEYQKAIDSLYPTNNSAVVSGKAKTLTRAQKSTLWQILTGNTSTDNNPYGAEKGSTAVAKAFKDRRDETKTVTYPGQSKTPGQKKYPSSSIKYPGQK